MPTQQSDDQRLKSLRDYYAAKGVLPSYSGLVKLWGYASSSAAAAAARRLISGGYLEKGDGGRLVPRNKFFELPLALARVPAGVPMDFEDLGASVARIDEILVRYPSRTFVVPIEGDSMIDAGLFDGDFVVVEHGTPCSSGNIVVAVVDGKYTVKFLAIKDGRYYLKPGNPKHTDIWPKDDLMISGLVVGSFRKMHERGAYVTK